jgi:hypothetical protein
MVNIAKNNYKSSRPYVMGKKIIDEFNLCHEIAN